VRSAKKGSKNASLGVDWPMGHPKTLIVVSDITGMIGDTDVNENKEGDGDHNSHLSKFKERPISEVWIDR
jgi:hypothetical protein